LTWIVVAGTAIALAQPAPTVNLKGLLTLIDTMRDTIPVSALSVAIYSTTTLVTYRAQEDQDGQFEMKDVRPGHYRLELGVPSRLKTLTIGGKAASPADFEIDPDTKGAMLIVLSMKVASLTVKLEGATNNSRLTAVLAPNDEFLTLRSQFTNPVDAGVTLFRFLPPGRYLLFVVDDDLSRDIGTDPKLRDALKKQATAAEVFANENTTVIGHYISRQEIEHCKRQAGQSQ